MGILKKKRKRSRKPRIRRPSIAVGCAFCWEYVPQPTEQRDVFSGGGCSGGRCECSAVYVIDPTGRDGGQALLDAQALACDGDLDRALALRNGIDFELKVRDMGTRNQRATGGRELLSGCLPAKLWFVKLRRE